jgi:hypothetical protein
MPQRPDRIRPRATQCVALAVLLVSFFLGGCGSEPPPNPVLIIGDDVARRDDLGPHGEQLIGVGVQHRASLPGDPVDGYRLTGRAGHPIYQTHSSGESGIRWTAGGEAQAGRHTESPCAASPDFHRAQYGAALRDPWGQRSPKAARIQRQPLAGEGESVNCFARTRRSLCPCAQDASSSSMRLALARPPERANRPARSMDVSKCRGSSLRARVSS